jgi:hypothetical protein
MSLIRNNRRYIYSILIISVILIAAGCTDNFNSLNTPKNKITTSNINGNSLGQVFSFAEYWGFVGDGSGWELMNELHCSLYSQIFTTWEPDWKTDQYRENTGWTNSGWNSFFSRPAADITFVKNYTKEHSMPVRHAIATVYAIPIFERMTDMFGPIPYSQFGNHKTSVKFDSQDSIYHMFFNQLDKAVAVLKKHQDETFFAASDIIYKGNVGKWLKFANSMRLRLAIRIDLVAPKLAKEEAEKAVAAGVITSNAGNALIATTANNLNYLTRWTYIDEFGMSATQNSILVGFHDPRLTAFWASGGGRLGGNKGFNGMRNGLPHALKINIPKTAGYSFVSKRFLPLADGGPNPPIPVLTAAQVDFCRAEGALRGWSMGGSAKEFYSDGIRASIKYWTSATPQEINKYINSTDIPAPVSEKNIEGLQDVNWNTPPESNITVKFEQSGDFQTKLEQIITQKWIDLFLQPQVAWAERRRTGYPRGYAIINSLNPEIPRTAIIRRLPYPTSPFNNNKKAVTEAVNKYLGGKNLMTTRLWWDVKPLSKYPDLSGTLVQDKWK